MSTTLTINGTNHTIDAPGDTPLLWVLRDELGMTGTKYGCGVASCGACTVHIDGEAVRSCQIALSDVWGAVTTIEGLATGDTLHPMQQAFRAHHGLQCGFCTPGMIMAAVAIAQDDPDMTEPQVREKLEGNICRCTGYQNIVDAVLTGARAMAATRS